MLLTSAVRSHHCPLFVGYNVAVRSQSLSWELTDPAPCSNVHPQLILRAAPMLLNLPKAEMVTHSSVVMFCSYCMSDTENAVSFPLDLSWQNGVKPICLHSNFWTQLNEITATLITSQLCCFVSDGCGLTEPELLCQNGSWCVLWGKCKQYGDRSVSDWTRRIQWSIPHRTIKQPLGNVAWWFSGDDTSLHI